ncbi:uncharacterized protein LOC116338983 [Contarinia nasturtii]|uniref:uncharacterized protein LOC116338983 n=1 Tax=Contarinia nasturtii TaxID=265458 RepID=UPI0012D49B0A|nr:uncharacterized protein LOC116338983 [Contarinia nasturtii]
MKIENILIEHFPRLKCANFFILFDQNFADVSSVRVHLRSMEIFVHFDNTHSTTIDLELLNINIQINSLSLLIAKDNLISFRINTASSFREEILPINVATTDVDTMKRLKLNVCTDMEFSIVCDNCSGPLTNLLRFRRILELPSENMDSNDWFCHKPDVRLCNGGNGSSSHHHQQLFNATSLIPNENDLLYGNFFALIHRSHIVNIHINSKHRMLHCKRCLSHIGECVSESAVKFWNGNVKFIQNIDAKISNRLFHDSNSLFQNFLIIVDRLTYDYRMLGRQTLKLLFEANTVKGTTFLFIQTMARNLELYQMNKQSNLNRATMMRVDGIKCLFLSEENTDPTLVNFWQKDVNVISAYISIGMLDATVEHLHILSKYVPEQFRINNGFCLSYLSKGIIINK